MYKKVIILTGFFLICFIPLPGQCLGGDSLLKKISFLRDYSGLSAPEQIKVLSRYEAGITTCTLDHDSVHTLLANRLGNLFNSVADFSNGINYFQRSITLINQNAAKPSTDFNYLIACYYWLSVFYDSIHSVADKMKALDSCIAISIRLKSIDDYCLWALFCRAVYFFDIGDYHRCISYAGLCESFATDLAGKRSKQDPNLVQYAMSSLMWKINALILLRKYDEAESLLLKKTKEIGKRDRHNLGVIYGSLAEILMLKGDFEKAQFYHNKAFDIEKQSGEAINCKAMLNSLGYEVWFRHYRNADKALIYYKSALSYEVNEEAYQILNSLESLSILNRIANIYVLKGKYNDALRYIQLAFDQIQPGFTETDVLHSSLDEFIRQRRIGYIATLITDKAVAFHQKYKATGDLNDIREAVRIYKVADQFLEKIKTEQSDVRSKLFWRSDRRRLYEMAIEACHAYANMTDAFYFFERSRAVLLYDELNELQWMNKEDLERQAQLKKRVAQLDRELAQEDKTSVRSRELQGEIIRNRQELDQLTNQIKARSPLYYQNFLENVHIALRDVQQSLLKGNDKLVEFFDGDSAVYSLIISPNQVFLERINKDSFDHAVKDFVSYVSNYSRLNKSFEEFVNVSYQLYELIFQKHSMSPGKIIVSPDSHYFPAEALVTNKNQPLAYLIENHPVSYTHSARFLMIDFNTKAGSGMKNFLGMAPVNFQAKFNMTSLIGSDVSLQALRSNFRNTDCLAFTAASKSNFMQEFQAYKVIQLYTHASDNKNAGEPEIYFADSVLYLSELMNEKKPFTKLIVLSACETGTGEWYRGEGVFSFNRGFAALGIPSSVTNLWSVDNISTYHLTELFYKHLAQGLPIDVSLQKAKLEFIKDSPKEKSLPYYWAATILAGKTDAIELKRPFPWKSLVLLATLGIGLFFFGYMLWSRKKKSSNRVSKKAMEVDAVSS